MGRFKEAVVAYERRHDQEAARLLAPLVQDLAHVAPVRQLAGLAAYRASRWADALRHLRAYEDLTGDPRHVPLAMDANRALGRRRRVGELWSALRSRSPGAEVLAEGRIVAAQTLADAGDLQEAISLLGEAGAARGRRNPAERHLRQWYALADLYERAGDLPRARELFARVDRADPDAYDVADRLAGLGGRRRRAASSDGVRRNH